jgi:hypothetical protein
VVVVVDVVVLAAEVSCEFFSFLDFFFNIYRNNLSARKIVKIDPAAPMVGGKLTWQTGEERAVTEGGFFALKPLPPSGRVRMQKCRRGPAILQAAPCRPLAGRQASLPIKGLPPSPQPSFLTSQIQ